MMNLTKWGATFAGGTFLGAVGMAAYLNNDTMTSHHLGNKTNLSSPTLIKTERNINALTTPIDSARLRQISFEARDKARKELGLQELPSDASLLVGYYAWESISKEASQCSDCTRSIRESVIWKELQNSITKK